jgi:hypothetical protein
VISNAMSSASAESRIAAAFQMGSSLGWARGGVNRHGRSASSTCAKMPGGCGGSGGSPVVVQEATSGRPPFAPGARRVARRARARAPARPPRAPRSRRPQLRRPARAAAPAPAVDESQRDRGRLARLTEPRLLDPDGRWLLGRVGKWMMVVKNAASRLLLESRLAFWLRGGLGSDTRACACSGIRSRSGLQVTSCL